MKKSFLPWLGAFETIRVDQGVPAFVEEHWRSLASAAKVLELKIPSKLPHFSIPKKTGRWRLILDVEGFRQSFSEEVDATPSQFTADVSHVRVGSKNWDSLYKTVSYLTHWQARRSVKTSEALLLNENGKLASGAMSNLFWVVNGKTYTPPHHSGCRRGVIRGWVKNQIKVTETLADPEALSYADEIFITNSWIGIRPVTKVGRRSYKIGPATQKLQKLFYKR